MNSPYGQTIILAEPLPGVECWNFTDRSKHTLPTGTRLLIEHVHDTTSTTCMLVDENGKHPGIDLTAPDGSVRRGYRFIISNTDLRKLGVKVARKTRDIIAEMIAHEQGDLDDHQTRRMLKRLKRDRLLDNLQGHYGREARRLNVA